MTTFAIPGQVIGKLSTHIPGNGTHVADSTIHASIAGLIAIVAPVNKSARPTISITTQGSQVSQLPVVNSTVLCRLLRVQQRQLHASILTVESPSSTSSIAPYSTVTDDETQFLAILRREDVRAYEKDKIVMNESFRVGDVIRAIVISLGDERNFYISTAGNEFGVVIARSDAGNAMVPVSWKEMKDIFTGRGEARKVAKPS